MKGGIERERERGKLSKVIFRKRKVRERALAGWLSWLEHCPNTPWLPVQSLVRAHTRINQGMHK